MNTKREFPGGNNGLFTAFKLGQKYATEPFGKADLVTSAAYLRRSTVSMQTFTIQRFPGAKSRGATSTSATVSMARTVKLNHIEQLKK